MACANSRSVLEQVAQIGLQLRQQPLAAPVAAAQSLPGQAELRGQRHDLLLDAVVQVALDPPALGVLGGDDAVAGRGQLGRLPLDLAAAARTAPRPGAGCGPPRRPARRA